MNAVLRNIIKLGAQGNTRFLEKVVQAAYREQDSLAYNFCINELRRLGVNAKEDPVLYMRGIWAWNKYLKQRRYSIKEGSRRDYTRYSALVRLSEETGVDVDNPSEDSKTKIGIAKRALGRGFFRGLNPKNPRQQERIGLVFKNLYGFARRAVRKAG
jgi:hypothetical protein